MEGNFAELSIVDEARVRGASVHSVRHRRHTSLSDLTRLQARPFESISVLFVLGRYCRANTKKKNPALPQNPIYKTIRIEYKHLPSR
jgi:hypothetical protein